MHRGNRGGAGQEHAERLRYARHRARSAHDCAGAGGGCQSSLDTIDRRAIDFAAAEFRPEAPAVGARAQALALVP